MSEHKATCPICGTQGPLQPRTRKEGYDLFFCEQCEHMYVSPCPTRRELEQLYSFGNSYQVQPMRKYDATTNPSVKNLQSLELLKKHARGNYFLDVGCSSGRLMWVAQRNGWVARGVELNSDTANIAIANGLVVHNGELETMQVTERPFDAIHLGDVIEHVVNPNGFLKAVVALQAKDGVIAVVTPNNDAFFPRATLWLNSVLGIPWSHSTPPYHLHQFSYKSLKCALEQEGYKIIESRFRRCEILYELGHLHVLRDVRHAIKSGNIVSVLRKSAFAALSITLYSIVLFLDRCFVWKTKDFDMTVVARKR